MKDRIVVSPKNLPAKNPIWFALLLYLLLEKLNAPEWVWGAVGLFVAILFIGWILQLISQEKREIFPQEKLNLSQNKSDFQTKVKQKQHERSNS